MATTTNYGWVTPDDTSLVKDGAAAIRTLGSSVDTTTKALNPSTTLGDIEYRSATANTNTRLGIGSTGQVLTVTGGVPTWATASGGGLTLIQETAASALSSLSFSSISGSYKQLLLVWTGIRHSATGSQFAIRLNNDSGTNYSVNGFQGQGTTSSVNGTDQTHLGGNSSTDQTIYAFGESSNFNARATNVMGSLVIDNYASATYTKQVAWRTGYYDNSNGRYMALNTTSHYNSTTAITSIDIVRLTGSATFTNNSNTSIRLYGVN